MCQQGSSTKFDDHYALYETIGKGGYSTVFLAISKLDSEQRVAVKRLSKSRVSNSKQSVSMRARKEVSILSSLSHPNIVHYLECFDEEDYFYIVTEYLPEHDLFTILITENTCFKEMECKKIIKSVLLAIKYLHDQNVIHRDLKLENIMYATSNNLENTIKLIDFGCSSFLEEMGSNIYVGTMYYAAPEIYRMECSGKAVDMWAIGVISYCLIYGQYPFYAKEMAIQSLLQRTFDGELYFKPLNRARQTVSAKAKDFISRLLTIIPLDRMTIDEALQHPWIFQIELSSYNCCAFSA